MANQNAGRPCNHGNTSADPRHSHGAIRTLRASSLDGRIGRCIVPNPSRAWREYLPDALRRMRAGTAGEMGPGRLQGRRGLCGTPESWDGFERGQGSASRFPPVLRPTAPTSRQSYCTRPTRPTRPARPTSHRTYGPPVPPVSPSPRGANSQVPNRC